MILALIAWLLYEVKIEDSASASEQSMTLNLQDFQPSSSSQSEEEIPQEAEEPTEEVQSETQTQMPQEQQSQSNTAESSDPLQAPDLSAPISDTNKKEVSKETLEALTKELFEKIAKSANVPSKPNKEKIAEKKVTPSEVLLENLLAQKSEEVLDQKRLAKTVAYEEKIAKEKRLEDKLRKKAFLKAQEKKQEMLAKEKAFIEEQERLAKKEEKAKQLVTKEAEETAREKAYLAQQEQKRKIKEAKVQKAARIAKTIKEKKNKQRKLLEKKHRAAKNAREKRKKAQLAKAKAKGKRAKKYKSKKNLANALSKQSKKSPPRGHVSHSTRSMIKRCYGAEFNGFSGTQKAFIEKNLDNIYVITQRVLSRRGYPNVAKRTHQEGIQLVTFYLHPNGRISRLRLKKRIGYASLDKNTLQVVRIAHANYPRPKTTTKITFYVEYSLN